MLPGLLNVMWLIFPAYVANSAAIDVSGFPVLKDFSTPMDFGKKFAGKRIFGDGKTWRGFVFGVLAAVAAAAIQQQIQPAGFIAMTPYLGFLLGFGALAGDLAASFIKRRAGLGRGHPVFFLDQLDYIFGAFFLAWTVLPVDFGYLILACMLTIPLHVIANIVAWVIRLKRKPW